MVIQLALLTAFQVSVELIGVKVTVVDPVPPLEEKLLDVGEIDNPAITVKVTGRLAVTPGAVTLMLPFKAPVPSPLALTDTVRVAGVVAGLRLAFSQLPLGVTELDKLTPLGELVTKQI